MTVPATGSVAASALAVPAATSTIVVTASATLAGGIGAHFRLELDGKTIGSATVGTAVHSYSFTATPAAGAAHVIQVVYTNDTVIHGQDRNLLLQSIAVNGVTVPATSSYEVYAPVGQPSEPGSGNMYWDGTASFSLPASYFQPSAPPPAAAFYVAVGGSDANSGSATAPFATLARAQAAMEGSTTHLTYLEGGTYALSGSLMLTSADSGFSIMAAPGQTPILDGGAAGLASLVTLNGASNVTLQGLTLADTAASPGAAALTLSGADNNSIIANHFLNTGEAVLLAAASSGNTLSGNQMDNSATSAVEVKDGSNSNVLDSNLINGTGAIATAGGGFFLHGVNDNTVSHNLVENTAGMGIGVENWDNTTVNVGNTITGNIVDNANTSAASTDSGAIYALGRSGVATQMTILDNQVNGTGGSGPAMHTVGIYLDDLTSGVTVSGNIVSGIGSNGLQIHGGENVSVTNNIFDMGPQTAAGVLFQAAPSDVPAPFGMVGDTVSGNIFYATSNNPTAYAYIDGGSPDISGNLYYDTAGGTLATSPPAQDTAPVHGNPEFVNEPAGNYNLGAGSAAGLIGFEQINQASMGLHPVGAHWY